MTKPETNKVNFVVVFWAMVLIAVFALGGGVRAVGDVLFGAAPKKSFFEEQYEAAKLSSDSAAMCFNAGMVAKQFLDERDLEQYQLWKAIEVEDCTNARPIK